ncbi:hypothetical protein M1D95_20135 [Bacillus sp. PK3-130]
MFNPFGYVCLKGCFYVQKKSGKWIIEGRGTGTGTDYLPWLKIQDASSLGRATRLKDIKTRDSMSFYQTWSETAFA